MKRRRRNHEEPALTADELPPIMWLTAADYRIIRIALNDRIQLMISRDLWPAAEAAQKVTDKITTLIESSET